MSSSPVPQLDLSGSPYDIGLKHGQVLRAAILRQIAIYAELFEVRCKLDWEEAQEVARGYERSLQNLVPHVLDEMRGIADGMGKDTHVSVRDIIVLNARSEIALGLWDDGCTSLAWALRDSGRQILAQNWDWRVPVQENLALVSITQPEKPKIWMVIEAGMVGKIGFNSASVGVTLNAIRARPISTSCLPIHVALRLALESTSVAKAIKTIENLGGVGSSQHILIADRNGAQALELSPWGNVYIKPNEDGLIVHTNHFLMNKFVEEPPWLSSSPIRLERAYTLCKEIADEDPTLTSLTSALLRERIFSDTFNAPDAICCSPNPTAEDGNTTTLFNIVMEFGEDRPPKAEVQFDRPGLDNHNPVLRIPWKQTGGEVVNA
ncbi:AAT-domain-containing protein [Rickenella mellea]|uniref:AAT-domain-containing protein n=1 Tax=Rickenella mellea TaxID=50990 RepID=A0A4Y7Q968_9AGAM|nr:AAT-domain-containing protein [Rickenella mellea]